jgi:hypothetical protein
VVPKAGIDLTVKIKIPASAKDRTRLSNLWPVTKLAERARLRLPGSHLYRNSATFYGEKTPEKI